jgi:hypothetical protein
MEQSLLALTVLSKCRCMLKLDGIVPVTLTHMFRLDVFIKIKNNEDSIRSLFDSYVCVCVCVCFFLLPTCSRVYVGFASVTHRLSILTSINIWVQSSRRTSTPQHLKTYIDFDFRGKIVRNKLRAFSGGAFYSKMEAHARRRAFGKGEIGLANKN